MFGRIGFIIVAFLVGLAVAALVPGLSQSMRDAAGEGQSRSVQKPSSDAGRDADKNQDANGVLKLTSRGVKVGRWKLLSSRCSRRSVPCRACWDGKSCRCSTLRSIS
jgi:hypothetical protein